MVCRLLKLLESYYLQTHLKITDDLEITLKLKFKVKFIVLIVNLS